MYSFSSRVRYSEVDAQGKLSPISMMNYMQDCSVFQTEEVTDGMAALRNAGLAFFVTAWQIRIFDLPKLGDEITTSTWVYKVGGLMASRAFRIADKNTTYVEADSTWILNDFASGHPIHWPEDIVQAYAGDTDPRPNIAKMPRSIKLGDNAQELPPFMVEPQHLDTNGHVNNARYIEFVLTHADNNAPRDIARIDAQYKLPAHVGDEICPLLEKTDGTLTCNLRSVTGDSFATVRLFERGGSEDD